MKRSRFNSRSAVALLFIVAAAFIPVKARAIGGLTSPGNDDAGARGARTIHVIAGAGDQRIDDRTDITRAQVRGHWNDEMGLDPGVRMPQSIAIDVEDGSGALV